MASALWSAAETKSPGPLRDTCRFSTSPKSRLSERAAFMTASVITVISGERIMVVLSLPFAGEGGERSEPGEGARSGDGLALSPPGLTAGPPSPAEGGGENMRGRG